MIKRKRLYTIYEINKMINELIDMYLISNKKSFALSSIFLIQLKPQSTKPLG